MTQPPVGVLFSASESCEETRGFVSILNGVQKMQRHRWRENTARRSSPPPGRAGEGDGLAGLCQTRFFAGRPGAMVVKKR
jgi:hypothetical protein